RGRAVEHVVVADVADPEDLAPQLALPRRKRDAVAVAEEQDELARVDAVRRARRGHDRRAVVVRRKELEAERLDPLAAGAAEAHVPLERGLETLLEQDPERDVQAGDERYGRGDRRVQRGLALPRQLPVPVEPR